jgi:hypothetical protein
MNLNVNGGALKVFERTAANFEPLNRDVQAIEETAVRG